MITRIFRAIVPTELHAEFEDRFRSVSLPFVRSRQGIVTVSLGRPTRWAPEEYVMVSVWESEQDIRAMAGEQWNQAFIPAGMEKYIRQCWVHHYEIFA